LRRATQRTGASGVADDLDLTAGDCPVAQNADAVIIERIPFPPGIGCLEKGELFFGRELGIHDGVSLNKSEGPPLHHPQKG
jgi:hypothetical protein